MFQSEVAENSNHSVVLGECHQYAASNDVACTLPYRYSGIFGRDCDQHHAKLVSFINSSCIPQDFNLNFVAVNFSGPVVSCSNLCNPIIFSAIFNFGEYLTNPSSFIALDHDIAFLADILQFLHSPNEFIFHAETLHNAGKQSDSFHGYIASNVHRNANESPKYSPQHFES